MNIKNYFITTSDIGVISANPIPTYEELAKFYEDIYYQKTPSASYNTQYSKEELKQRRLRADLLLYAIAESNGNGAAASSFLDIGCGEGFLLNTAKEQGYTIQGIDFSTVGLNNFNPHLLCDVEIGDSYKILDQFVSEGRHFNVCVMQNLLEHIISPEILLRKTHDILLPEGIVVITIPNDFSMVQKELIKKGLVDHEYWFLPPQHLHYFNVDSIRAFANKCAFDVIDTFADFPIDFFLFHPGSNYIKDSRQGKDAHKARVMIDLILAKRGLAAYLQFCRAVSNCGAGRNITVLMRQHAKKE